MARALNTDDYISKMAPFAQEILSELRTIVHEFCPTTIEAIKWGMPCYMYKGAILCNSAGFKEHCAFGFWLETEMDDKYRLFSRENDGMGSLGKLKSVDDIPSREILGQYILEAMALVDAGVKLKKAPTAEQKKNLVIPVVLVEALKKDAKASKTFESFSYSHKKEYAEWIAGAKTEATALRRLETTLSNLREGKSKEWKYQK